MPVGTLSYCPKIVYNGITIALAFPCQPWVPNAQGVGGSDVSGAGIPVAFQVRRDQFLTVTLVFFESEWHSIEAWLAWAQSTAGAFTFQLDKNDAASAHTVWLQSPAMGEQVLPARHPAHVGAYTIEVVLRDTTGTRFDYRVTGL